jgi:hypothetical protein
MEFDDLYVKVLLRCFAMSVGQPDFGVMGPLSIGLVLDK